MGLAPMLIQQIFDIITEIAAAGHDDPGRRAERQAGALASRPRLRPRDRQDRQDRHRCRAARRPDASVRPTSASPDRGYRAIGSPGRGAARWVGRGPQCGASRKWWVDEPDAGDRACSRAIRRPRPCVSCGATSCAAAALDEQLADVPRSSSPTAREREDQLHRGGRGRRRGRRRGLPRGHDPHAAQPRAGRAGGLAARVPAVPPPRSGQRADGGRLPVRRAARDQARATAAAGRGARRQPVHGAALASPRRRCCGRRPPAPCAPGCPQSRQATRNRGVSRQRSTGCWPPAGSGRERVPG